MTAKVVRDGLVAVLYSPGYGAGWSTWNSDDKDILLFHPKLVEMVEKGEQHNITDKWLEDHLQLTDVYNGGAEDLVIKWIPEGTQFYVKEYDGSESIILSFDWNVA
jgi:hypothetical protein